MQSKTSFFNGTLFRKNLTRFWPLWGLASFLAALFPLALLVKVLRDGTYLALPGDPAAPELTRIYYSVVGDAGPVLFLIYGALCALAVWSYLYSPRSVGLLHTLPIRREGLFLTSFLSGLAMVLLPCAVAGVLSVLTSLAAGAFDPVGLGVTVLAVLGQAFFFFASATFVCFITGNAFAMAPVYFLLHFLAVILDWLVSAFARGFIFGFDDYSTGAVEWLSPAVYLQNHLGVISHQEEVERVTAYGERYTDRVLVSVEPENFHLIALYALAGLALTALAVLLYRSRRSESAGDVVAVGALKPVFRYGVAALAALLGGQFLYSLFWGSFQSGQYVDVLPLAVSMALAGIIGYYAASMLLAKSLRVFRGSWKGILAVALGCAAVCCGMKFDLLGVADRVPAAFEVKSLYVNAADNSYTLTPEADGALLEQVRAVHQAVIADEAYILSTDAMTALPAGMEETDLTWESISLTYYLKDGGKVSRWYRVPVTRDRLAQAGTYDDLLDQFVNSDAVKARRLHLDDSFWTVTGGSLYLSARNESYDLGSREAEAVLAAIGRDLANGDWGTYDWFRVSNGGDYAMDLSLEFDGPDGEGHDYISISLTPAMGETVAALRQLGLVTDVDLVTYRELEPEDYAWEAEPTDAGPQEAVPTTAVEVLPDGGAVQSRTAGEVSPA